MGGSSTKNQTVTTNPWAPAADAVRPAINAARGLIFDENNNLIQRDTDLQRGVAQSMYDYAQNDPMQAKAMQYYGSVLGGETNPYLDAMFGRAADKVQSRLSSQFAAAGRYGSGDQARETAQAYNDLANQMYGGQYASDQARMMQAAQLAPQTAYQGFARQMGAAEGLENFDYNQQMAALNQYLGMVQPMLGAGGTQVTPITRNKTLETIGAVSSLAGAAGSLLGGLK